MYGTDMALSRYDMMALYWYGTIQYGTDKTAFYPGSSFSIRELLEHKRSWDG